MKTVRLTTAQAIVRYLIAQRIEIDGELRPLFPGVFAIFGHGNVTCLGQALEEVKDDLPTWRGQNEQGMALAAVGLRQGHAAAPDHGGHQLHRAGRHQHGHGGRGRPRQPPARPAAVGRHVRQPHPGSRPAAGGGLRGPVGDRERHVQARHPLLGPHRQAGAGRPHPPPRGGDDAGPGHVWPRLPRPAPGRPGRGLRLPRPLLRHDGPRDPPAPSGRGPAGAGGRRPGRGHEAADRRRRRCPLLPRRGGAAVLRRAPQHPGRGDGGRQGHAAVGAPAQRRAHRLDGVHVGQRAGRGGRRGARRRVPAAGLHDRIVDGVRQRVGAVHRAQHGLASTP